MKYGLLQHHLNGVDDSIQIPESELLCKRDLLEDDEDDEAQSADSTNEPEVPSGGMQPITASQSAHWKVYCATIL